jgi:hypothetical protein
VNHTTEFKVCPACQQPAVLDMQICQRCGRQYKSTFVPQSANTPACQVRMSTGLSKLDNYKNRVTLLLGSVGVIAFLALAYFSFLSMTAPKICGVWHTGDWYYDTSGLTGGPKIWTFYRNNTGEIQEPMFTEQGGCIVFLKMGKGKFDWHIAGDKIFIEGSEHTYSVTDDKAILIIGDDKYLAGSLPFIPTPEQSQHSTQVVRDDEARFYRDTHPGNAP